MRARISRFFLHLFRRHTPALLRLFQLRVLMSVTADAFGVPRKNARLLRTHCRPGKTNALSAYASFTEECTRMQDADPVRLYRYAFRLGSRIRQLTGFTAKEDLQELVFWLYNNIGITMQGDIPGELAVSSCFFSRFYTPRQCRLMSAMDAGITAGICGGGKLCFTRRLTEGCETCRACFYPPYSGEPSSEKGGCLS